MQSMILARLLATRDLLLNRYSHHISILNLQYAHRLSPREKNDAMVSLCCIISVVVFKTLTLSTIAMAGLTAGSISSAMAQTPARNPSTGANQGAMGASSSGGNMSSSSSGGGMS